MFGGYATHWVADRRLQSRSRELNAMLLRLHIMPWFGDLALDRITPPMVRSWRTDLLRQGRSESTAAQSYRLLRAVLNTAVNDDRLLRENPCRMRGVDKEPTSERPTASVDRVWRLSALMPRDARISQRAQGVDGPIAPLTRGFRCGAGDENRTRMTSLEGRGRRCRTRAISDGGM